MLRLIVAETGGERVVLLRIIDGPQAAQARRAGSASGADGRRELLRVNVRARAGAPTELADATAPSCSRR
ncbi:MAG TPA: hypothetical protein VNA28_08125 [Solirubrobacteraceae bacterium]|nr:hypothetical protein [Solirubrobacteraceae bacterium]